MANLNVGGEIKAPIITATETINCDTLNVWFGGAKIIDSGSNANGYWVRFADGTQICCGRYVAENNRSTTRFESYDVERAPAQYIAIGRWK